MSRKAGTTDSKSHAPKKRGRTAVRIADKDLNGSSGIKRPGRANANKAAKVRENILTASLEYFGTLGFDGATTRAIAERAGITHTLVLYHFKSKEQLWIATMEHVLSSYLGGLKESVDNSHEETAEAALKTFIQEFVRLSAQYPQIHRIMTLEGNQESDRLRWIIDHYLRDHFNLVKDLIRRGQGEGSIRECDPARLYYFIIGVGGTPFTLSCEYKALTGRDVFSETEILRYIAFIYDFVFTH
jgi:AcrR family transcriptional regulator